MSIETAKLVVAVAAGASTGTGTMSPCPAGYLEEVYLDYGQTNAATNVVIYEYGRNQPILTVSANQSDGAYYPRAIACGVAGGTFASTGAIPIALANPLVVNVSSGNVAAAALTVYAKIRKV